MKLKIQDEMLKQKRHIHSFLFKQLMMIDGVLVYFNISIQFSQSYTRKIVAKCKKSVDVFDVCWVFFETACRMQKSNKKHLRGELWTRFKVIIDKLPSCYFFYYVANCIQFIQPLPKKFTYWTILYWNNQLQRKTFGTVYIHKTIIRKPKICVMMQIKIITN